MSKIEETFGMRSLEEAMRDLMAQGEEDGEESEYDPYQLPVELHDALDSQIEDGARLAAADEMLMGRDTERKLDAMHDILMGHAETLASIAMELDAGKAPRAFEVMNGIIKNAMDAANSKRDHQIKTQRLILDQKKFEHEINSNDGTTAGPTDKVVAVMTTADLVRSFRKELETAKQAEARTSPTDK